MLLLKLNFCCFMMKIALFYHFVGFTSSCHPLHEKFLHDWSEVWGVVCFMIKAPFCFNMLPESVCRTCNFNWDRFVDKAYWLWRFFFVVVFSKCVDSSRKTPCTATCTAEGKFSMEELGWVCFSRHSIYFTRCFQRKIQKWRDWVHRNKVTSKVNPTLSEM